MHHPEILVHDLLDRPGAAVTLPVLLRESFERFFNAPLDSVHVHLDERLPDRGLLAVASGDGVHVAPQAFRPDTRPGRRLLAHELAHVLQQRCGLVSAHPCALVGGTGVVQDPRLEAEADALAALWELADAFGEPGRRNLVTPVAAPTGARRSATGPTHGVAQCVMLHAKDAIRKVDWIGNGYTDEQAAMAKKIIEDNRHKGVASCTVNGLDGKKYGHESTGERGENANTSSASVWWSQSFGSPLRDGTQGRRVVGHNSIADGIRVCGLGTHIPNHKGKPAYRLLWRVTSGLADRFYLKENSIKVIAVAV
jgi:hypothetical protein